MPPPVPEELANNPEEAELWRNLARLFEDYRPEFGFGYSGTQMRIHSFRKVSKMIDDDLAETESKGILEVGVY
jgi:hypothetical protein